MKLAILSGKGGTGKTMLSVNLFSYKNHAVLLDCDVEEPNDHLFIEGRLFHKELVTKQYPVVTETRCIHCERCGDFCQFNAIVPTKKRILVYEELCHDCGGCKLVCPTNAIRYENKAVGTITSIMTPTNKQLIYGTLEIGEISGVSIIEHVKKQIQPDQYNIIDCPPGTSCSTVEAVQGADYAIIVTEPTVFGKSDMAMVVELLDKLHIPRGIIINKADLLYDHIIEEYAKDNNISILGKIPFEKTYAKELANGNTLLHNKEFLNAIQHITTQLDGEYNA